jgi:regulator of sirC expression with transglutaminase-like and TPR domain
VERGRAPERAWSSWRSLGRALAREQAGDARGAIEDFERALELAPGDEHERSIREDEQAIRARIEHLRRVVR